MSKSLLTGILMGAVIVTAALAFTKTMQAQGGRAPTGRAACVNVVWVFNEYQRQKDLTEEIAQMQEQLQAEDEERRKRMDKLAAELDAISEDDPTFAKRTHEMLAMQIDYKNWLDLKQADMTREIGLWSIRIYKEILGSIEQIAERDGYDLVLYRGKFEAVTMDPEQIKEQIRRNKLLYANSSVDISQAVLDMLNSEYRAEPKRPMLYVP